MKSIDLDHMQEEGLCLYTAESKCLRLTSEKIQEFSQGLWEDDQRLPRNVREAAVLQRCDICPLRAQGGICDAVRVPLTLFDEIDRFRSYDKVTAVYVGRESSVAHISHTTMQQALKYVAFLGLLSYCQKGRTYWKNFRGVVPLESSIEIARQFYLNIYWRHRGDEQQIRMLADQLSKDIQVTTKNQVDRLRLICENDAFSNAYANAQVAFAHLTLGNMPKTLEESFLRFGETDKG